jgi:hypothetical protein
MTSGSAGPAAAVAGVATSSAAGATMLTTRASPSFKISTPFGRDDVLDLEALVELQGAHVEIDAVRNVRGQAAHAHVAEDVLHDAAADLHAGGFALDVDRHVDVEFFRHGNALEVDVDDLVGEDVALKVFQQDDFGAGADFEVHEHVHAVALEHPDQFFAFDDQVRGLFFAPVDDGGDFAADAKRAERPFRRDVALVGAQFNGLHGRYPLWI